MIPHPLLHLRRRLGSGALFLAGLVALFAPRPARADFGLTTDPTYFTVDTGAGLVFKVRRQDYGSHTQSPGDLASLVYHGIEYQDQTRGSQVNSGFDWLYKNQAGVDVQAARVGRNVIKITVQAGDLTHYYIARRGHADIYMGTYFTSEPSVFNLCRYIVRIPSFLLPNGPTPSDIRNAVRTVEAHDIFGLADGTTRSKHYSNMRLKDWRYIGATGQDVGIWIVRGNNEGNSGGPFYRCLLNQCGTDQEITYIVNYGEVQTEPFRTHILNTYTLVFTNGKPPHRVHTRWMRRLGLTGYVGPEGRGAVAGAAITGLDPHYAYTVGFANAAAQYWTDVNDDRREDDDDSAFDCRGMLPGTYTMTVYKNELAVATQPVTVTAGQTTRVGAIAIVNDPSTAPALWRIGDWDGTPKEFLNGDKIDVMHPSDVRMSPWVTPTYVIGVSTPGADFPAYQWKAVNNPITIKFNLTEAQIRDYTLRIGLTIAFAGGRPFPNVNGWHPSKFPGVPPEPKTRSLTVGSYRGNNVLYTYQIPASALMVGENTLTLTVISGSSGSGFLSPGCSYDAVDLIPAP